MHRTLIAAAAILLPAGAPASPALDAEEVEFVRLINAYRAENGLPCLSVSPTANVAADYMSRAMGEERFFSHNEPPCDGEVCTGRDPFERLRDFGHVGWTIAAENIFAGSMSAHQAFESWRHSPGHDRNMRRAGFTAMGIARVEVPGSPFGSYWTNTFSDLVDGTHDCAEGLPAVGYGDPEDDPGGTGGAGGEPDPVCEPPVEEERPDDGWGIGLPSENPCAKQEERASGGGGCASAGGAALPGLAVALALLRRR